MKKVKNILLGLWVVLIIGTVIVGYFMGEESNQKYLVEGDCRYTIAKYRETKRVARTTNSYFNYVADERVQTITDSPKLVKRHSSIPTKELRFIVRYSVEKPSYAQLIEYIVPEWVKGPPINGWAEFPPDINWIGAVIDNADADKYKQFMEESSERSKSNRWFMEIPDSVDSYLYTKGKLYMPGTRIFMDLPENYQKVDGIQSIYVRDDERISLVVGEYDGASLGAPLGLLQEKLKGKLYHAYFFFQKQFVFNAYDAYFVHYYDPYIEKNCMHLLFGDDHCAVDVSATYIPGTDHLKEEAQRILFSTYFRKSIGKFDDSWAFYNVDFSGTPFVYQSYAITPLPTFYYKDRTSPDRKIVIGTAPHYEEGDKEMLRAGDIKPYREAKATQLTHNGMDAFEITAKEISEVGVRDCYIWILCGPNATITFAAHFPEGETTDIYKKVARTLTFKEPEGSFED